ncbi:MAG: hypothetical protein IPH45_00790 [Bacteroidales bacterium]|nr:hypothetical protein [Bacteroidales bacterium]
MIDEEELDLTNAQLLRLKAEERLKVVKQKAEDIIREMDLKRIVHELQVHQIELELQNEELMKAFQIAENALKKYTMLYDLAPVGFFTLDTEGYISELNFTGAELLGDKRFVLIHKNFKLLLLIPQSMNSLHF